MNWLLILILVVGVVSIAYMLLMMGWKIEEVSHHDDERDEHETSSV